MKKLLAAQSRPQEAVNPKALVSPPFCGWNIDAVLLPLKQSSERSTTVGAAEVAAGLADDVREVDTLVNVESGNASVSSCATLNFQSQHC